jgi:outer membrane biosynthesis protein TonB
MGDATCPLLGPFLTTVIESITEEYMLTEKACLWSKIVRKTRGLASLVPIFALALLLAGLLSSEKALSYFQSPTSPLPTTEEVPPPTEMPSPTVAGPKASPPPTEEAPSADTPPPTQVRPTPTSPPPEAPPTLTATVPTDEEPDKPTPSSTQAALLPAVKVAARPTAPAATEIPAGHGLRLWPWILLGVFSIGAIAVGVFLLQREASAQQEREEL